MGKGQETEQSMSEQQKREQTQPRRPVLEALLNENHRRTLAVVLRRLERATAQLEAQLTQPPELPLRLTRTVSPFNEYQRQRLQHLAHLLQQEIADLANECQLEAETIDAARVIQAEFSLLWSELEETRPRSLTNYGALHPQAGALLEPHIARLIELTLMVVKEARQE